MSSFEQEEIALLRQRIVRLEEQVENLYKHLRLSTSADGHIADDPEVIEALRSKNLITAIKIYREKTNVGLAEAKSAVEEIQRRLNL